MLHYVTYGEQSASALTAECGVECSTWDKPLQYVFEIDKVTCLECLRAYATKVRRVNVEYQAKLTASYRRGERWEFTPEEDRSKVEGDLFAREIDIFANDELHSCAVTVCGDTQALADARAKAILAAVGRKS